MSTGSSDSKILTSTPYTFFASPLLSAQELRDFLPDTLILLRSLDLRATKSDRAQDILSPVTKFSRRICRYAMTSDGLISRERFYASRTFRR